MSIELKADVYCDHKGCCNKTTSSDISTGTFSQYGHEEAYVEINSFDDKGWTLYIDPRYWNRHDYQHYCPEHKPKEKKAKK